MREADAPLVEAHDLLAATSLLSRLPVPVDHGRAAARGAAAAWAWPLVGAVLGAAAGAVGWLAAWLGLPPLIGASLALATLALLTGALHEDGLADCADGLGSHGPAERVLEIMGDSRIGAYGALALVLAVLARAGGIAALEMGTLIAALALVGAGSRAAMVLAMALMPAARRAGLSAGAGRPGWGAAVLAAVGATLLALAIFGSGGLLVLAACALAPLPLLWFAWRRIGGQTGDVLGATQQLAEVGGLAAAAALFPM
ncbi:MAG: adenosylcobinamide-GDP ribazoletransferase [Pseudomonadota bacterium]